MTRADGVEGWRSGVGFGLIVPSESVKCWKLFVQETQCEVPRFSDRKQPLILGGSAPSGLSGATHPLAKTRENLTMHVLHFEQRAATLGRGRTVYSWKLDVFFLLAALAADYSWMY